MNLSEINNNIRFNADFYLLPVREVISDILKGIYASGDFVALRGFPVNNEDYTYDISELMDSIIKLYGKEEWKACVLTDEFHGHMGVYSIIGAKMGIKAREIFSVDRDVLEVIAFSGSKPPYSCMADGLQASTGATLGQGTIIVSAEYYVSPGAEFRYKGRSIVLTLKDSYIKKVENVIGKAVRDFGLNDETYWNTVRQFAIKCWLEWDRNNMFEVEEKK
jgi:pyrimidine-specific ribonucleoside hydrolase